MRRGPLVAVAVVLAIGALPSCARPDWLAMHSLRVRVLRQRAAFDLECPEASLTLAPLGAPREVEGIDFYTEYGVLGCGARRVYLDANSYDLQRPRWVGNSP